jgi:Leucine-rich repeat (LRR) protein
MNLAKELQEKLGEHDPIDVDELILDDIFEDVSSLTESNKKDFEKYSNLVHLSLNGFGLKSLDNFPKLSELSVLELRGNQLTGKDLGVLVKLYPKLYKLKVGDNPISSINVFDCLSESNLSKLELQGTAVANEKTYREVLFKKIKNLDIIDNLTKEGDEVSTTNYDDEVEGGEDQDFEGEEDFDEEDEFEEYDDEEDDDDK